MKAHDTVEDAAIDAMTMKDEKLKAMVMILQSAGLANHEAFQPFTAWLPVYEKELERRGLHV